MLQIGAPGHPLGCRSEAQMIIQIVGMIGCPTTEDLKVLCGNSSEQIRHQPGHAFPLTILAM